MDPLRVAPRMTESEDDSTKKTRNWIARFLHRGRYGALPVREGDGRFDKLTNLVICVGLAKLKSGGQLHKANIATDRLRAGMIEPNSWDFSTSLPLSKHGILFMHPCLLTTKH